MLRSFERSMLGENRKFVHSSLLAVVMQQMFYRDKKDNGREQCNEP